MSSGTLNAAQQDAVEHGIAPGQGAGGVGGPGPLIVLAGPGTGKTRVITERVARLIENGAAPESVVAVTFTIKAAEQLRDRLRSRVGNSVAERVNAATFHSLGMRLLRRFGDTLEVPVPADLPPAWRDAARLRGGAARFGARAPLVIDAALANRLLRDIVREAGLFPWARAEGVREIVESITGDIHDLSNRGVTPQRARAFAEQWRERLAAGRGSDDRELDPDGVEADQARLSRFADTARAYQLFDYACRVRGWCTFDDLIMLPIRILTARRDRGGVGAIIRDEWRHFVVDEFQDVNGAQIELLRLLCPPRSEGAGAGPDVCVVGDDDQSIYAFRGADERAFARFEQVWDGPGCVRRIKLTENYRSQSPVIAVSNALIVKAASRFEPDKVIERPRGGGGGGDLVEPGAGVECVGLADDAMDADVIASMILLDRASKGLSPDARGWSNYAVIPFGKADVDRIAAVLRLEGIPVRASRRVGAIEDPAVQDVLAWIELLANPDAAWAAHRLLTRPPIFAPPSRALEWARAFGSAASRLRLGLQDDPPPDHVRLAQTPAGAGFVAWLEHHVRAAGLNREGEASTDRSVHAAGLFLELAREFIELASQEPAEKVVERIIARTDAAHAELLPGRERAARVGALVALLGFARNVQARLETPGNIGALWAHYNDLDDESKAIRPGEGAIDHEDKLESNGVGADESTDAVQVINCHQAKGLEWETVFVPGANAKSYGKKRDSARELPAGLIPGESEAAQTDEARRVFYVACTRARRKLVLLSKQNKSRSKAQHFFEELVHGSPGLVNVRSGDEIWRQAAASGVLRLPGAETSPAGSIESEAAVRSVGRGRAARRDLLDRARSVVRSAAAESLEFMQAPRLDGVQVGVAAERLADAARRMAVIAEIEHTGRLPAWLSSTGKTTGAAGAALQLFAENTARAAAKLEPSPDTADRAAVWKEHGGLKGPLKLNYTFLKLYLDCPRCFYVREVLGLPEKEKPAQIVGKVIHAALERFYALWRGWEDAAAPSPPGVEELVRMGRTEFMRQWPHNLVVDPEQLAQLEAQLRLFHARLHESGLHVLELERKVVMPYTCSATEGVTHTLSATLDRIDQVTLPDGSMGLRLVDYKTGKASKRLLEPENDDLQLGIYTIAMNHYFSTEGGGEAIEGGVHAPSVRGTAEYWILSTAQKGVIPFADLDLAGIHETLAEVIRGISTGQFDQGKECRGDCEILGS